MSFYRVNITYILKDGTRKDIKGKAGDNAMYLAHRYDIPLEGNQIKYLLFLSSYK